MNQDMMKKLSLPLWLALTLTACQSDWRNGIVESPATPSQGDAIAFTSSVVTSQSATRSDASIVNLHETWLPESKERSYVSAEVNADGTVSTTPTTATYYAGIFGYYMGQKASTDFTGIGGDQPVADLMFNQKADIGAATFDEAGKLLLPNTLHYEPLRFWPNNVVETATPTPQHERCTFWAYYPWNEAVTPALYGIDISREAINQGRISFTMNPDASQHVDFMMSDIVTDANKDNHPLRLNADSSAYEPTPVQLNLHHMLAQVRLYAFVRGADKMVYQKASDGTTDLVADDAWFDSWAVGGTIIDEYGNEYKKTGSNAVEQSTRKDGLSEEDITKYGCGDLTKAQFVSLGLRVPDETRCKRWNRDGGTWDVTHSRRRANINYKLEFNNIHTRCTFSVAYDPATQRTRIVSETPRSLGSITVGHYVMNPYWFRFDKDGQRVMLNDSYMYGFFEDTPAYGDGTKGVKPADNTDGMDWSTYAGGTSNAMGYALTNENLDYTRLTDKHYNYPPGNIILAVPQEMDDEDVPNVVITAYGQGTQDGKEMNMSGRVTVNMLNMGLKWESGFIYSYAFIENDLRPDDDKVRGPESITVAFDPDKWGSQW